ncbi:MAG: hypothetical protein GKR94_14410 [Gammaproteobacteria bacterium]|nr:hypothetical protein [Gammaproteobacteria bacterium]
MLQFRRTARGSPGRSDTPSAQPSHPLSRRVRTPCPPSRWGAWQTPCARTQRRRGAQGCARARRDDLEAAAAARRRRRVYNIDIGIGPRCAGSVKGWAVMTEPGVLASILAHFAKREARAPPAAA